MITHTEARKEAYSYFKEVIEKKFTKSFRNFCIKQHYNYEGKVFVAMFESELWDDLYIELVDKEFKPIDSHRPLYKWKHHVHLEEYIKLDGKENLSARYLIPIDELVLTSSYINPMDEDDDDEFDSGKDTPIGESKISSSKEDLPFSQATIRDVYALLRNKPVSNKEWINQMIKENG